jgi:hypothetical protein
MICILHGYLLEGSGSNLWTRSIIQSLCRQGKTVHLMCQENHPEIYDFSGKECSRAETYAIGLHERPISEIRLITSRSVMQNANHKERSLFKFLDFTVGPSTKGCL